MYVASRGMPYKFWKRWVTSTSAVMPWIAAPTSTDWSGRFPRLVARVPMPASGLGARSGDMSSSGRTRGDLGEPSRGVGIMPVLLWWFRAGAVGQDRQGFGVVVRLLGGWLRDRRR